MSSLLPLASHLRPACLREAQALSSALVRYYAALYDSYVLLYGIKRSGSALH